MYVYYHLKMKQSKVILTNMLQQKHTMSDYIRIIDEINSLTIKINNLNFINN